MLAEGSLLLDAKDADGAIAAFRQAHESALARADAEVRGRALESMGFAYEQKGQLDDAQKSYATGIVRARLKKYGAKDEELDWMGLDAWLKSLPKGTKLTAEEIEMMRDYYSYEALMTTVARKFQKRFPFKRE